MIDERWGEPSGESRLRDRRMALYRTHPAMEDEDADDYADAECRDRDGATDAGENLQHVADSPPKPSRWIVGT